MFYFRINNPPLTWGLGNRAAYTPGPGGPIPDPRLRTLTPAPIYGRVGVYCNYMSFRTPEVPGVGWRPWAQMPINNAYATELTPLSWNGWLKPPPTSTSGF